MESFRLDGLVALVTGAGRGLGAAMARALGEAGADVALLDRDTPPRVTEREILETSRVRTACLTADLSDRKAADGVIPATLDALGRLDILVNNAGIIRRAPADAYSDDDWDAVIETNLSAVFRLCRSAAPHMLRRGSGKIINVASLLSFQGGITVPAYTAAKSGVAGLTRALSNEWAGRGVNVNAIAPGYMVTDNTKPLVEDPARFKQITERIPAGRWGSPDDLGGAVVFLASRASDYVHGHVLVVDGGWMGR